MPPLNFIQNVTLFFESANIDLSRLIPFEENISNDILDVVNMKMTDFHRHATAISVSGGFENESTIMLTFKVKTLHENIENLYLVLESILMDAMHELEAIFVQNGFGAASLLLVDAPSIEPTKSYSPTVKHTSFPSYYFMTNITFSFLAEHLDLVSFEISKASIEDDIFNSLNQLLAEDEIAVIDITSFAKKDNMDNYFNLYFDIRIFSNVILEAQVISESILLELERRITEILMEHGWTNIVLQQIAIPNSSPTTEFHEAYPPTTINNPTRSESTDQTIVYQSTIAGVTAAVAGAVSHICSKHYLKQ